MDSMGAKPHCGLKIPFSQVFARKKGGVENCIMDIAMGCLEGLGRLELQTLKNAPEDFPGGPVVGVHLPVEGTEVQSLLQEGPQSVEQLSLRTTSTEATARESRTASTWACPPLAKTRKPMQGNKDPVQPINSLKEKKLHLGRNCENPLFHIIRPSGGGDAGCESYRFEGYPTKEGLAELRTQETLHGGGLAQQAR